MKATLKLAVTINTVSALVLSVAALGFAKSGLVTTLILVAF